MKVKTYFKIVALVLIVFTIVVSCQEETFENEQSKEQKTFDFTVYVENTEHLKKNNPVVYKKIENALKATKTTQKENTPTTDFSLDLEQAQIIEKSSYTQYTLKVIHPESATLLINYLLLDFNDGQQYQYFIKYPIINTDDELALDHANIVIEKIDGDTLYQKGFGNPCLDGVPEIVDTYQTYGCTQYKCGGDGHVLGEQCDCGVTVNCKRAYEECGWTTVNVMGCSGGSPSGQGTGTTGGSSNNNDEDEPVEIIPFVPNWQRIVNCVNNGFHGSLDANNPLPLSTDDISWLQTLVGGAHAIEIVNFLNNNGCEENKDFIDEAIEALRNNGEVDFEEKIILDSSFTGKVKCIYDKLKRQNLVNKALARFNNSNVKNDLKFKLDSIGTDLKLFYNGVLVGYDRAVTYLPNDKGVIIISLNNVANSDNNVAAEPNLLVAQTLFHEIIHAEFFRQILDAIERQNFNGVTNQQVLDALANSQYHLLYEYFRSYRGWSHNYMADYYRTAIARVTQEFATGVSVPLNEEPLEFYKKLAWRGLMETDGWNELTNPEQEVIRNTINNYKTNNLNQTCTE